MYFLVKLSPHRADFGDSPHSVLVLGKDLWHDSLCTHGNMQIVRKTFERSDGCEGHSVWKKTQQYASKFEVYSTHFWWNWRWFIFGFPTLFINFVDFCAFCQCPATDNHLQRTVKKLCPVDWMLWRQGTACGPCQRGGVGGLCKGSGRCKGWFGAALVHPYIYIYR